MPIIFEVFSAILYQFFCFRIAEAHADVIFQQEWHF